MNSILFPIALVFFRHPKKSKITPIEYAFIHLLEFNWTEN